MGDRLPRQMICYLDAISHFEPEVVRARGILSKYSEAHPIKGWLGKREPRALVLWLLEDGKHVYGQTNFNTKGDKATKFVADFTLKKIIDNFFPEISGWPLNVILLPDERSKLWFEKHATFSRLSKLFVAYY